MKFKYLSLRGIRGAEHTPLGGLKGPRPRHFASLLKLRVDTCHHTQGRDIGQPWEHLRHSLSLHLEPLYGPVPLQHNTINTFPTFLVEDKTNMHKLCKWVILIIKPSVTRFCQLNTILRLCFLFTTCMSYQNTRGFLAFCTTSKIPLLYLVVDATCLENIAATKVVCDVLERYYKLWI